MNVICFDTEKFVDFERNAKINKEEAWDLQIEFCQQNNLEWGSLFISYWMEIIFFHNMKIQR